MIEYHRICLPKAERTACSAALAVAKHNLWCGEGSLRLLAFSFFFDKQRKTNFSLCALQLSAWGRVTRLAAAAWRRCVS